MRRIFLIFCFLFCAFGVQAEEREWRLVWSDEFDGSELDASKWNYIVDCWGGGNDERQCYTEKPENVAVRNGHLIITALQKRTRGYALPKFMRDDPARRGGARRNAKTTKPYSSGRITTQHKGDWLYGRFVIRAKLPIGQGAWPAIWMLPTDEHYGPWAASGEIDIMEAVNLGATCEECEGGHENRVHGTLHYGDVWPKNEHQGSAAALLQAPMGFHEYALEWREGEMQWFVDGEHYATLTSADWFTESAAAEGREHAPFDQRFYLLINLAIGGGWPERQNDVGFISKDFPKYLVIDWVRIYQSAGLD